MTEKNYPEEIFKATNESGEEWAERVYDLGKKHAQADTGDWHNLTAAIKAGEPIDFEKLDGREAKCVHDDIGTLFGTLNYRGVAFPMQDARSWSDPQIQPSIWCLVMRQAWDGEEGWKLYVKGELPLRKRTADELPFGTEFIASNGLRHVRVLGDLVQKIETGLLCTAKDLEVSEVLGMYGQKESE